MPSRQYPDGYSFCRYISSKLSSEDFMSFRSILRSAGLCVFSGTSHLSGLFG